VQLHRQNGGCVVWRGNEGRHAMVREDASLAEGASAGGSERASFGDATRGSPQDAKGTKGGILESVSLLSSSPPPDGLRGLPSAWPADRQRRDGGSVQDGVHAAFQTIGNAMEPRIGPGDLGFAGHLSEQNLAGSIRRGLGFARTADAEQRCLGNRQPGESSGLKGSSRPSRRIIYDAAVTSPSPADY